MENNFLTEFDKFIDVFFSSNNTLLPKDIEAAIKSGMRMAYVKGLTDMQTTAHNAIIDMVTIFDPYVSTQLDAEEVAKIYMDTINKLKVPEEDK